MRSIAIIGLMAVIGFTMAGCGDASSGPTGGGGDTAINIAAITGVTAPTTGATPVTTITASTQYTGTVTWAPAVSGTFAASTAYTATITLTPKSGYTLQGVATNFFTVAGATATNPANSGVIAAVFPATGATAGTVISDAAIGGVTAPATGATPVTSITANAQYTGTVTWAPAVTGTFAASTAYTATITLAPTSGYILNGVAANFFTVAGATATNPANSGVITAVFPATGASGTDAVISIAAIAGVTAPAHGATPVTTITANDQYSGTVTWAPTVSGTFDYATAYTATITLTPKSGYTLTGVAADFFTVAGSTSVSNAADTGVITAAFPATENNPQLATLQGTITITPNTGVFVNTQLTATYSGTETVSFQWHKDSVDVGSASTGSTSTYTPDSPGSYTVTVSLTGYNPETSQPVTVHNHPSAAISGSSVTVTATKHNAAESGGVAANTTVTINLTDATVEATKEENAKEWFSSSVAGLSYSANIVAESTSITITITGIPEATSTGTATISIPAGIVKDAYDAATTAAVTVTGNITYAINEADPQALTASAAVSVTTVTATKANYSGTGGVAANATVTITLTHATVHTALTAANVSTWFHPTVPGLTYLADATEGANIITVTIAGAPTEPSNVEATVIIPEDEILGPDGSTRNIEPLPASGHITYAIDEAADPEITGFDFTPTADLKIGDPNTAAEAVVGTFSNVVGGTVGTHTYTLVVGSEGSTTDNASFEIDGINLKVRAVALAEHKTYKVYVQVEDVAGQTFAKECDLIVAAADLSALNFTAETNLVIGADGKGGADNHGTEAEMLIGFFTPVGGAAPYTYALVAGTGDDDNALFVIEEQELFVGAANLTESRTYKVFVKVTDSEEQTLSNAFTFIVREPPTITTTILDGGPLGQDYGKPITATGDIPITWSIESGALPTGLSLAPATGLISGRPSKAGESTFVVKATNAAGSDTKSFTIDIIALNAGENAVEVNFTGIADESIDIRDVNQLSAGGSLTVTVEGEWESYAWLLDGKVIAGETTDEITIDGSTLKSGAHTLTAVVVKKGTTIPYSKVLKFVK